MSSAMSSRFFMTPGFSGNITPLRTFISTRSGSCFHSHLSTSSPRMASVASQASGMKLNVPPFFLLFDRSPANSCS